MVEQADAVFTLMFLCGMVAAIVTGCIYLGYWMGRKTKIPFNPDPKPKPHDPGPAKEPEGDIFSDAMSGEIDGEERVPTV